MRQIMPTKTAAGDGRESEYLSIKAQKKGWEFKGTFQRTYTGAFNGKPTVTHYFDSEDGKSIGINGTVVLNDILAQVAPGTKLVIKKIGTSIGKTGNTTQLIEVYVADGAPTPTAKASGDAVDF